MEQKLSHRSIKTCHGPMVSRLRFVAAAGTVDAFVPDPPNGRSSTYAKAKLRVQKALSRYTRKAPSTTIPLLRIPCVVKWGPECRPLSFLKILFNTNLRVKLFSSQKNSTLYKYNLTIFPILSRPGGGSTISRDLVPHGSITTFPTSICLQSR